MGMNIEQTIHQFGGTVEFARRIGASAQQVSNWRTRGVPAEWCPDIERATSGQVRCEELRPDIDWAVLRNSDCQEPV
jgi:DNA-binding transcriptional regulator YdaS (Cro superfamily)